MTGKHVSSSETCACVNKIPYILKTLLWLVICFLILKKQWKVLLLVPSFKHRRNECAVSGRLTAKKRFPKHNSLSYCRIFKTANISTELLWTNWKSYPHVEETGTSKCHNPLTAVGAPRALIYFTLSNARRFYSSRGKPLDGKGLTSHRTGITFHKLDEVD